MNRTAKSMSAGLMAVALVGIVALVGPQLMASQAPATDVAVPAGAAVAASTASQSDMVDAYNWRTTISPKNNKTGL